MDVLQPHLRLHRARLFVLDARRVSFVVRVRKDAWLRRVTGESAQVGPLFAELGDGGRQRLRGKWTVYGFACFVTATREQGSTWVPISNRRPNDAAGLYRQRWQIETLFGALKSRGFDLEATHLGAPERIERLFGVLALVWVLGVGHGQQRVRLDRTASHGRPRRSLFRAGLDGLTRMLSQGDSRPLRRSFRRFVVYLGPYATFPPFSSATVSRSRSTSRSNAQNAPTASAAFNSPAANPESAGTAANVTATAAALR